MSESSNPGMTGLKGSVDWYYYLGPRTKLVPGSAQIFNKAYLWPPSMAYI